MADAAYSPLTQGWARGLTVFLRTPASNAGLVACWLPARRAAAVDPVDAIRVD